MYSAHSLPQPTNFTPTMQISHVSTPPLTSRKHLSDTQDDTDTFTSTDTLVVVYMFTVTGRTKCADKCTVVYTPAVTNKSKLPDRLTAKKKAANHNSSIADCHDQTDTHDIVIIFVATNKETVLPTEVAATHNLVAANIFVHAEELVPATKYLVTEYLDVKHTLTGTGTITNMDMFSNDEPVGLIDKHYTS